jgi:hypothetical protein
LLYLRVQLSEFLTSLFSDGTVNVPRTLSDFLEHDLLESGRLIKKLHQSELFEMPAGMPALHEEAALWAAQYLFRTIQLVLLRDLEADVIEAQLKPYPGEADATAHYSIDLIFRHLGPLFKFSSGISPDDPLVQKLKETAAAWPLSSVGLNILITADTAPILDSPALRSIYLDRIILTKDISRLKTNRTQSALAETVGLHQDLFWPGLELQNELTL